MFHLKIGKISIVASIISLALAMSLGMLVGSANAAVPGCYANSQGNYEIAICPTGEPYQSGVTAGSCYVAVVAQAGIGPFNETPCDGIQSGQDAPALVKNDCNESANLNASNCGIIKYLETFINALSALVGVVVVGSLIYGGIQYSSAGSDPQKVSAAKKRILNSIFAFVAFLFTYALLQYLVPGGVF